MEERTGTLQDILDILSGKKKPSAEVTTSADSSWTTLVGNFWLYGLIAVVAGMIIYRLIFKKS